MNKTSVLGYLAEEYPQLYLNPDTDTREAYRRVVLRGEEPVTKSLSHYRGDPADRNEIVDTPAGQVRVVTLGNRQDFELVLRGLMAAKDGPLTPIPESQGAAMLTVFNWPRIHTHLAAFPEKEREVELKRFTAVRENYIDTLVVLSRGPYSHVDAVTVGETDAEWLDHSDTIRRFHELSHVICRRLYPGDIAPIRDELVADAVGLIAAYGQFDLLLEQRFLGVQGGRYVGGRLGNYTDNPDTLASQASFALERIKAKTDTLSWEEPFDLIPVLMEVADIGEAGKA